MAAYLKQKGIVLTIPVSGGATKGDVVEFGAMVGIAMETIAANDEGPVQIQGVFEGAPKVTGTAWDAGDALKYTGSAFAKVNLSGDTAGIVVAHAALGAGTGDTTGTIVLGCFAGSHNKAGT